MSTRKSVLLGLFTAVFFLFSFGVVGAVSETFSRNLRLGDVGEDVMRLQVLLNTSSATRIALTGPGSQGNETMYYGARTVDAVRRYQELYRQDILIPAGLYAGTGFFGSSTRQFINTGRRKTVSSAPQNLWATSSKVAPWLNPEEFVILEDDPDKEAREVFRRIVSRMPPMTLTFEEMRAASRRLPTVAATNATPTTTRAVLDLSKKQNEFNTDMFLKFLEEGGYLDDMDEGTREIVKQKIRENSKKDIDELIKESETTQGGISWSLPPMPTKDVPEFLRPLAYLLLPQEVQAAWEPIFGGAIYYRFYCWYSGTWGILIGLPMPAWLGYTYTQEYAYWQFPYSIWAKGWYVPGTQTCYIYVYPTVVLIPTMGEITTMVGTSEP